MSEFLNIEDQVNALSIASTKKKTEFNVKLTGSNKVGKYPTVVLSKSGLGANGKKSQNVRGLNVIDYEKNGNTLSFTTIALRVNSVEHKELRELCTAVLQAFLKKHSPVSNSLEYQAMFPSLDDGTKVHNATNTLLSPALLNSMEDQNNKWNSPCNTYADFLFGNNEGEGDNWYLNANVSQGFEATEKHAATDYRVLFFDDKARSIGTKVEEDMEVYKKGGLPLMSSRAIQNLVKSSFYKESYWKCHTAIQLYGFNLKLGEYEGKSFIYPEFKFRTVGSIRMQTYAQEDDPNAISFDERNNIIQDIVFADVSRPKKRKRKSKPVVAEPMCETQEDTYNSE